MRDEIESVLLARSNIQKRVAQVARQIAAAEQTDSGDTELTIVPILTGSIIFVADLIRHLPLRMQIHLISVHSYPGTATKSRGARIRQELTHPPENFHGRHVLIVDDILDSGSTLKLVRRVIEQRQPASIRTCVLLRKRRPQALAVPVDFVCFDIEDRFVVGYGLDYNDYYRNLPDIMVLREDLGEG